MRVVTKIRQWVGCSSDGEEQFRRNRQLKGEGMAWFWIIVVVLAIIGASNTNKEKAAAAKKVEDANRENQRRREEAENYILNSGDKEAIKMLMLARANPANYTQVLSGGMNKGNSTVQTALGVMTGVVAGNLVANAITASAIESALHDMQAKIDIPSPDISSIDTSSVDTSSFFD